MNDRQTGGHKKMDGDIVEKPETKKKELGLFSQEIKTHPLGILRV